MAAVVVGLLGKATAGDVPAARERSARRSRRTFWGESSDSSNASRSNRHERHSAAIGQAETRNVRSARPAPMTHQRKALEKTRIAILRELSMAKSRGNEELSGRGWPGKGGEVLSAKTTEEAPPPPPMRQ